MFNTSKQWWFPRGAHPYSFQLILIYLLTVEHIGIHDLCAFWATFVVIDLHKLVVEDQSLTDKFLVVENVSWGKIP